MSPAPQPKPLLGMLEAIHHARTYVETKHDLSDHYLDRVWVNRVSGLEGLHWIVSWSPDGMDKDTQGWVIVAVDMKGRVFEPKEGVQWMPLDFDKETRRKIEHAKRDLEEASGEVPPQGSSSDEPVPSVDGE